MASSMLWVDDPVVWDKLSLASKIRLLREHYDTEPPVESAEDRLTRLTTAAVMGDAEESFRPAVVKRPKYRHPRYYPGMRGRPGQYYAAWSCRCLFLCYEDKRVARLRICDGGIMVSFEGSDVCPPPFDWPLVMSLFYVATPLNVLFDAILAEPNCPPALADIINKVTYD